MADVDWEKLPFATRVAAEAVYRNFTTPWCAMVDENVRNAWARLFISTIRLGDAQRRVIESFSSMADDTIHEPRVIERKRLWEHGEGGKGDGCERRHKPVYTPPEDSPRICRQWDCDNEHWYAKGYVQRDKNTKQIVVRESPDGRQEKVI